MIQDMSKVPRCAVVIPRQVDESSFWTSKDVYETSQVTIKRNIVDFVLHELRHSTIF